MKVLVFAPHPDDEILGCGGTIARYIASGADVDVCIVTSGKPPVFDDRVAKENGWPHSLYPEIMKCHELLGIKQTYFLEFPCVLIEQVPRNIVTQKITELVLKVKPDVVFIPHFGDMQKDHTVIAESIMVAVRPKYDHIVQFVYSYETLSETEWNINHAKNAFLPNVFVDITEYLPIKLEAMSCYRSQLGAFPDPRSLDAVESLAKVRGSTMWSKAAESFMLIREYRK